MITIFTPKGTFTFDPAKVSDEELGEMGTSRGALPTPEPVIDIKAKVDQLEARLKALEDKDKATARSSPGRLPEA